MMSMLEPGWTALAGRVAARLSVLLLLLLPACATRSLDPTVAAPHAQWTERTADRLIALWQGRLEQYVDQEGGGDPVVLSHLTALQPRDVLRPGRIVFGVLDVEADLPGRSGWDIQGVLVGTQAVGGRNWYVFLVGIVRRSDYRPREVQDLRLVAVSSHDRNKRSWVTGAPAPQAVRRYQDAFAGSRPIRFPADTDHFSMGAAAGRVLVTELQSGADWALELSPGKAGGG
jgi:hypothetical protein